MFFLIKKIAKRVGFYSNKKAQMLQIALPAIKSWQVQGSYLEFGVYKGKAFIEAYKLSQKLGLNMHFYAFDSFEGLPSPSALEGSHKFYETQYSCSQDQFLSNLKKAGVNLDYVTCIKGFYGESLTTELQTTLSPMKASIVWIDCDLYESTIPVLNFIVPFLQTGTIVCYDDWFSFGSHPMKGEIRATREWLEQNSQINLTQYRDFGISGRSFIVHIERD